MMNNTHHISRSISSLTELKPGDHIQVPSSNAGNSILSRLIPGSISSPGFSSHPVSSSSPDFSSSPVSSSSPGHSSSLFCNPGFSFCCSPCCSFSSRSNPGSCFHCSPCCRSSSRSNPDSSSSPGSTSVAKPTPEKCDGKLVAHHLLVVKVINENKIHVIHKTTPDGVVEEEKCYLPKHVTVLDYKCPYSGEAAIARARGKKGERYGLITSNCEHFVTEARTGVGQSHQVQRGVAGGVVGVGVGAAAGATTGALVGAGVGSFIPVVGTVLGGGAGALVELVSGGAAELLEEQQQLRVAIRLLMKRTYDIAYGTLNRLGCAETYTESMLVV